jgi:hypothetical protein
MPNVSFDIFFDKDFINITATRGKVAPKAKPEWKVRSIPKLPPKPVPEDTSGQPRPIPRQKLTTLRQPHKPSQSQSSEEQTEQALNGAASDASDKPKRKPPKLGPKKSASITPTTQE